MLPRSDDAVVPVAAGLMSARPPAALLRRLDWRWLLPTPPANFEHMVLLGADDALAELVVELGVAHRVSRRLEPAADVVAVLSGTAPPLVADVGRALQLGGVVYWETDRTRRGRWRASPARLTAELRTAGLHVDARYALRPHPDRCELYLPLDHEPPLHWYLDDVYVAARRTQVLGERLVRWLLDRGIALAHLAPFHAIVAHVPPSPGPTVVARAAELAHVGPELRSAALLTDSGNRAVILGFGSAASTPAIVVKAPKTAAFEARTTNEQAVTRQLRELVDASVAHDVPRPLGTFSVAGRTLVAETALGGRSMQRRAWDRTARFEEQRNDLDAATDWIAALHRDHPIAADTWNERRLADTLSDAAAAHREHFGRRDDEDDLFARAEDAGRQLFGARLPVVWQHRDYSPSNLTRDGVRVRVLDWEGGRPGIPFADPIRFVVLWHEACRRLCGRDARGIGLADLFAGRFGGMGAAAHPATAAARAALTRYGTAVGIDTRFIPVVLVASAVELTLRRAEQQRDAGAVPRPQDRRASTPEMETIAHLVTWRDRLFEDHG